MRKLFISILFVVYLIIPGSLQAQYNYTASINGSIIKSNPRTEANAESENGKFWCKYDITEVSDEMRKLKNFSFYEDEKLLFTFMDVPGSDVSITNAGFIIFFDHSRHFENTLKLHIYSYEGIKLQEKIYKGANLFELSDSGNFLAVGSPSGIEIFSFKDFSSKPYPKAMHLAFSEDEQLIALSDYNLVKVYNGTEEIFEIDACNKNEFVRGIKISTKENALLVITKKSLTGYSLTDQNALFTYNLSLTQSFKDIKLIDGLIVAGIHIKSKTESKGEMLLFDFKGNQAKTISGKIKSLPNIIRPQHSLNNNSIPWPFTPFDSMRTVWNHYEQHMGGYGADYSYLHQGLDLITPIAEPTYAVKSGIVKCVLTLGGDIYWRLAISDSIVEDYSNGWLYAHLIENTIQFDVGDTVLQYDYLGDIVQWTSEWGHIHFVEIRDSGNVWFYDDNEWGINFNPLLILEPMNDTIPPMIENVFEEEKFAFCENETSNYLSPQSLNGEIDIIVKVYDYIGDSEWQQPAYKINYGIKRISDQEVILPKQMAHILNHTYPFYASSWYEPFATVMYKRDATLFPSSWMDTERNFHHIITNSDGDSIISLNEKYLAFNTSDFYDSEYRIFVEAFDPSGNSVLDSMDVYFNNGISSAKELSLNREFRLVQNYPNPFNPSTTIRYQLPKAGFVTLKVYDILGNEVAVLVNEYRNAGSYNAQFTINNVQLSSGVYFYQLRVGDFVETKKMIFLK